MNGTAAQEDAARLVVAEVAEVGLVEVAVVAAVRSGGVSGGA